ncbi:MAG: S-layer homology domain-containing protein, partial [Firmicutes bacterium]|nr:S-layer homology domain-containing protein [Bacillota bacterium]
TAYLWAEKDIDYLFEQGIVKGCGDGTYRPLNNISRAEFASIIARSFTFEEVEGTPISFTDIQNHWAKEDITKLSSLGIIIGYQDKFRPNDAITRQEAATVLNRILKYEGAESPTFSDLNDISQWALPAVANLSEKGIIKGYPDGTFLPLENLDRAETAALLKRILMISAENN